MLDAPKKTLNEASFKTSISRMKNKFASLSRSDKQRLAACFANIKASERMSVMKAVCTCSSLTHTKPLACSILTSSQQINWDKASKDFEPSGKTKAASFRTSVQRLLKNDTQASGATKPSGKKRKAADSTAEGDKKTCGKKTKLRKAKDTDEEEDAGAEVDSKDHSPKVELAAESHATVSKAESGAGACPGLVVGSEEHSAESEADPAYGAFDDNDDNDYFLDEEAGLLG